MPRRLGLVTSAATPKIIARKLLDSARGYKPVEPARSYFKTLGLEARQAGERECIARERAPT